MRQPGNKLNTIYISERVQERLRPARYAALTVLVAPMGYGKTTAVEWYLQSRERDAAAICVRANAYSDSVPLFWDGLCRALERAGFAELAGFPCPEDAAGRGLFLELACRTLAGERECVLFLDDFHLLRDRRAAELLCEFARCAPPNVHVIAASRDRFLPGEEVFRLGGRLLQLGKDDLRLNRTELNIYARRCGLDLTEAQTERLEQTCEGWFSAVYLNLRALHEQGALLTEGTDIYEMFTAALLAPLEEDKRLLLAVMSQADEFTAEMARAVTGLDGARALLRELTGQNAFITHLPDGRTYRFHHMLKSCAGAMFAELTEREAYLDRFGDWFFTHGDPLRALRFYARSGNAAGWLRTVAEDAGVQLASADPAEVFACLDRWPREALRADPTALLVLMRRAFSWREIPRMLALRDLLLEAADGPGLSESARGDLRGECDLIMSFLCYNDIAKMSALHRSACRQMSRPAVSIRRYGSFTFGSPSVLMMFHRTPGQMAEEVAVMHESMPYYYQVTREHGAGAEQIMEAEAAYLQGRFAEAQTALERARYRAEERGQAYILQCCAMLALRLHLAAAGGAEPPDAAEARAALLPRRDATLLLTFDAARAYYAALCGAEEQIPPSFAQHTLADARMLDVAKPMLGMVETQVWLAQGAWRRAVAQAEALLAPCQTLHYALVRLHLLIQLAAAYARLDDRAAADAHLRQALAEAEPDGLVMPFAENYRDLKPVLDGLAADSAFLREIRTHGAAMESRISALRHGGGEPDGALTARERELAELVAQRLSNREIAERMYLSEGTVKQYVNRIYAKLGIEGSGRQSKRQTLSERMRMGEKTEAH